jgi:hypothetical protein
MGLAVPSILFAQQVAVLVAVPEPASIGADKPVAIPSLPTTLNTPSAQPAVEPLKLERWVDVKNFEFSVRYRSTADANGYHLFDFGQQRSLVDGRFKFDPKGNYTVNVHASSGKYFNWAYTDVWGGSFGDRANSSLAYFTPAEMQAAGAAMAADPFYKVITAHINSRGWGMSVRQLYMSATPIKQITAEFGGLGIERGVNTEMTTYDDDGYMTGERIRFYDPKHVFFDQIAVTYGYLGDIYFPSIFDRGDRFKQSNYHQFLVEKKFAKRLDASADYTWHLGTDTMREAVNVNVPELRAIDKVRVEAYQRVNDITLQGEDFASGSGFGVTVEKRLPGKVKMEAGFASVDKNYPVYTGSRMMVAVGHPINGDQYALGNRFFTRANIDVTPSFRIFGSYSHDVDTNFMTLNKEGYTGGGNYEFSNLFHRDKGVH